MTDIAFARPPYIPYNPSMLYIGSISIISLIYPITTFPQNLLHILDSCKTVFTHKISQVLPDRPSEISDQSHATPVYDELPKAGPGRYIRGLRLQPGDASAKLVCRLETVSLENSPGYEALSYCCCWGSESNTYETSCNGSRVTVTQNLRDALQDLRAPDKIRILWVDALCINQRDGREKTQRVMMGDIYRRARKVAVHLGSGKLVPDISLAIDLMRRIAATDYELWPYIYISHSGIWNLKPCSDEDFLKKGLPTSEHPAWKL
jgi:hypothetical protein